MSSIVMGRTGMPRFTMGASGFFVYRITIGLVAICWQSRGNLVSLAVTLTALGQVQRSYAPRRCSESSC